MLKVGEMKAERRQTSSVASIQCFLIISKNLLNILFRFGCFIKLTMSIITIKEIN